ncbi:MAG: o-succinylbenzoate synthase [Bacteroidetes bacterium]|nr:o-succinylbenzoate synthase [Bacteroidota bacterium]
MYASYRPYSLEFKRPVLTSRSRMTHKHGYYLTITYNGMTGTGECSYIEGLSIDDLAGYEAQLLHICSEIEEVAEIYYDTGTLPIEIVHRFPSIAFGLETALLDLKNGGRHEIIEDSAFFQGKKSIPINGLVWMGDEGFMREQIAQKLADGFRCIKIKVGAIDFDEECRLIESIRTNYTSDQIEIRLDANGAFTATDVRSKLKRLSAYTIHSIEQPIKPQQYVLMHQLCRENIIPIALDEELIGTTDTFIRQRLLETIRPQYIILKPSLLGGLAACDDWIAQTDRLNIPWWATSALEGNIGLNAIAQWAASKETGMVQGLGTGALYANNLPSPMYICHGQLLYDQSQRWG